MRQWLRHSQTREVGTCCGTGFIAAVGTVTVVIVYLGEGDSLGGIGDAGECVVCGFVEFGD